MARYVKYHRDGTVRMDWYTFQNMPIGKVMRTIEEHTVVRPSRNPIPLGTGKGVKQYA